MFLISVNVEKKITNPLFSETAFYVIVLLTFIRCALRFYCIIAFRWLKFKVGFLGRKLYVIFLQ